MCDLDIPERRKNRLGAARELTLPFGEHLLHGRTLQILLRAAEVARNDGELAPPRVAFDVPLGDISQRPDDDVPTVFGRQLRCHRLQTSTEEEIEEERFDDVVAVMAQRDLRDAVLRGEAV